MSSKITADEALRESIRQVLNKDEWYALRADDLEVKAARLRRRLRAKGYDLTPYKPERR